MGRRRTDSANYANSSTVLLLLSYKQGKTLFKVVVSYYLDQINLDRTRPPTTTMLESIRKWTSHKGHHYGQSERELGKTKNTAKLEAKQLIFWMILSAVLDYVIVHSKNVNGQNTE